jgi:hypothetical protein
MPTNALTGTIASRFGRRLRQRPVLKFGCHNLSARLVKIVTRVNGEKPFTFHSHMPTTTFTLDLMPGCCRPTISTFTLGGVLFKVLLDVDGYVGIRILTPFLTSVETNLKIAVSVNNGMDGSFARLNPVFNNNSFWGRSGLVPKSWREEVTKPLLVKVKLDVVYTGSDIIDRKFGELVHQLTAIVGGEEERVVADGEFKYHALCASLVNIVTT